MINRQAGHLGKLTRGNWFSAGVKDLTTGATNYIWTGLPPSCTMIEIPISEASLNIDEEIMIRLGDSAIVTTGYRGSMIVGGGGGAADTQFSGSDGFLLTGSMDAGEAYIGIVHLIRIGDLTWVESAHFAFDNTGQSPSISSGRLILTTAITQVQLLSGTKTGAGTNTFDGGEAELWYFA